DIEAIVADVVGRFPKGDAAQFREFVAGRARAAQNIAAYLAAYVDFESDQASERTEELTRNTPAYHLADDEVRAKLLEVFRITGRAVETSGDADFRALIRKSPLPPADVLSLKTWTGENLAALQQAVQDGTLLDAVFSEARKYLSSKSI